ncbi:hypothetical protein AAVH_29510, partial [Aphelenchoides avenae]
MSSVPSEVFRDVLQPLDRWILDDVQMTNRRFLQLIVESLSDVCLRQVNSAGFLTPNGNMDGTWFVQVDGPTKRKISHAHKDTARLFSDFVQALRSSRVAYLTIN